MSFKKHFRAFCKQKIYADFRTAASRGRKYTTHGRMRARARKENALLTQGILLARFS